MSATTASRIPTPRRAGRPVVWATAAAVLAAVVGLTLWLIVSLSAGPNRVTTVDAPRSNHSAGTQSLNGADGNICYPRPVLTGRFC